MSNTDEVDYEGWSPKSRYPRRAVCPMTAPSVSPSVELDRRLGVIGAAPYDLNELAHRDFQLDPADRVALESLDVSGLGGLSHVHLPESNRRDWQASAETLRFPAVGDSRTKWDFVRAATEGGRRFLPDYAVALLKAFATDGGPDAVVLDNLPLGDIGPTPAAGRRSDHKDPCSELALAGVITQIAEIFSWKNEKDGVDVADVVPVSGLETTQSNASRDEFGGHSDNAVIPSSVRQELIGLIGLRNPTKAATLLWPLTDLLRQMSPTLVEKLRKPVVQFALPASFSMGGWGVISEPRPVIYRDDRGIDRIAANTYSMKGVDAHADEVVREFVECVRATKPRRVVLEPGRVLLFKDNRGLHGREAFVGDRWVQRAYGRFDLTPLRETAGSADRREHTFELRHFLLAGVSN